jgi:hypothetical protein
VAFELDTVSEPVINTSCLSGFTNEAVLANEADTAFNIYEDVSALVAQLAVPNRDPVIPLDTFKEPVIIELLSAMTPLRATNSFGICYTLVHFP